LAYDISQWIEVERLQSIISLNVSRVVSDQQFLSDQMDIRLDAGESLGKGVEQWTLMLVVVVGMRIGQGLDRMSRLRQRSKYGS